MAAMEKSEVTHAETLTNPGTADEVGLQKTVTVDTFHGDEAATVLANYHGEPTWDDDEEKRVKRKIDCRLLPILCATYGLQVRLRASK
jgi:hypothetical protein